MSVRPRYLPSFRLRLAVFALFAVLPFSHPVAQTEQSPWPYANGTSELNVSSVANLLSEGPNVVVGERVDGAALTRFYTGRDYRLAWSGTPEADANAQVALAALSDAEEHGLNPEAYHLEALSRSEHGAAGAVYDLLMTDGLLKYMRDVHVGRIAPEAVYRDVDLPNKTFDSVSTLASALEQGSLSATLAHLPPPYPQYALLWPALAKYRKIAAEGGWPQVSAKTSDNRLRERLMREDPRLADEGSISAALRVYQSRNGLEADGKLNAKTIRTLNISAAERVAEIEANLDRWRWLPAQIESRFVAINVPDGILEMVDHGELVLHSKVIVGASDKRTPIFRVVAKEVTVNPPWNVPASIIRNEILPQLRRKPDYLASQHMVFVGSNRIQQLPGPHNALGRLKIEMPNDFDVYLHDTPAKNLFARNERALSHGCMRVQEIMPLASLLLSGDKESSVDRLRSLIAKGETRRLALNDPVPIYVLYNTVIAEEDGTVQFRSDIYGRNKQWVAAVRRDAATPTLASAER